MKRTRRNGMESERESVVYLHYNIFLKFENYHENTFFWDLI